VSGPIVVIDSSEVREGKLEELKTALEELAAFVEADDEARMGRDRRARECQVGETDVRR
jgi:hypothetical protein